MKNTQIALFLLIFTPLSILAQNTPLVLKYDKPASVWTEALPIGNGYMGAMLFSDPLKEHLQLNESTLYSGDPNSTFKNIDVRKHFKEITDLINAKKHQEAQAVIRKEWLGRNHQMYQPMGDFWIDFDHKGGKITDYQRTLDMATATATAQYKVDNTVFKRTYFANYPDHVIVLKLNTVEERNSDKIGKGRAKINCTLHFSTPHTPTAKYFTQGNTLVMQGKAPGFALRRTLEDVEKLGDQYKYPELFDAKGNRKPNAKNFLYDTETGGLGMAFETQVKTTINPFAALCDFKSY